VKQHFEKNKSFYIQVFRYILIGGLATILDFTIFYIASNVFKLHFLIANSISFMFGLTFNYFLSREWVFNKKSHNFKKDFTLYVITSAMGLIINNLIMYVLIDFDILKMIFDLTIKQSSVNLIKLTAKMIATIIVLIWNFISKNYLVFRKSEV
jgi:putative flippase GtrA